MNNLLQKHKIDGLDVWQFREYRKPYAYFSHRPTANCSIFIKTELNAFKGYLSLNKLDGKIVDMIEIEGYGESVEQEFQEYIKQ